MNQSGEKTENLARMLAEAIQHLSEGRTGLARLDLARMQALLEFDFCPGMAQEYYVAELILEGVPVGEAIDLVRAHV